MTPEKETATSFSRPPWWDSFECPITHDIMIDPVIAEDGHTYERASIERWYDAHDTSPLTREDMPYKTLIPNTTLRRCIDRLQTHFLCNARHDFAENNMDEDKAAFITQVIQSAMRSPTCNEQTIRYASKISVDMVRRAGHNHAIIAPALEVLKDVLGRCCTAPDQHMELLDEINGVVVLFLCRFDNEGVRPAWELVGESCSMGKVYTRKWLSAGLADVLLKTTPEYVRPECQEARQNAVTQMIRSMDTDPTTWEEFRVREILVRYLPQCAAKLWRFLSGLPKQRSEHLWRDDKIVKSLLEAATDEEEDEVVTLTDETTHRAMLSVLLRILQQASQAVLHRSGVLSTIATMALPCIRAHPLLVMKVLCRVHSRAPTNTSSTRIPWKDMTDQLLFLAQDDALDRQSCSLACQVVFLWSSVYDHRLVLEGANAWSLVVRCMSNYPKDAKIQTLGYQALHRLYKGSGKKRKRSLVDEEEEEGGGS